MGAVEYLSTAMTRAPGVFTNCARKRALASWTRVTTYIFGLIKTLLTPYFLYLNSLSLQINSNT
jgi:hypothetical protein